MTYTADFVILQNNVFSISYERIVFHSVYLGIKHLLNYNFKQNYVFVEYVYTVKIATIDSKRYPIFIVARLVTPQCKQC